MVQDLHIGILGTRYFSVLTRAAVGREGPKISTEITILVAEILAVVSNGSQSNVYCIQCSFHRHTAHLSSDIVLSVTLQQCDLQLCDLEYFNIKKNISIITKQTVLDICT